MNKAAEKIKILLSIIIVTTIIGSYAFGEVTDAVSDDNVTLSLSTEAVKPTFNPHNVIEIFETGLTEAAGKNNHFLLYHLNAALVQHSAAIVVSGAVINEWFYNLDLFENKAMASEAAYKLLDTAINLDELDEKKAVLDLYERALKEGDQIFDLKIKRINITYDPSLSESEKKLQLALIDQSFEQAERALKVVATKKTELSNQSNHLETQYYRLKSEKPARALAPLISYYCYKNRTILESWQIFSYPAADVYLFIPKNIDPSIYSACFNINGLQLQRVPDAATLRDKVSGWAVRFGLQKITEAYRFWYRNYYQLNWTLIKDIYKQDAPDSTWLFLRAGHGMYSSSIARTSIDSIDPMNKYLMQQHGGLSIENVLARVQDLGGRLKTFAAIDVTCFGGGYHASIIAKQMNRLLPEQRYIYAINAIGDVITYVPELTNFDAFFTDMRSLEKEPQAYQEFILPITLLSIRSVLPNENNPGGIASTPLFLMKNSHSFDPLLNFMKTLSDKIKSETSIYSFHRGILLHTRHVMGPIRIIVKSSTIGAKEEKIPPLISMIPGDALHIFENISTDTRLDKLIKEFFFGIYETSHKRYFIKNLSCQNYANSGIISPTPELNLQKIAIRKEPVTTLWGAAVKDSLYIQGAIFCNHGDRYYKAAISETLLKEHVNIVSISKFKEITEEEYLKTTSLGAHV